MYRQEQHTFYNSSAIVTDETGKDFMITVTDDDFEVDVYFGVDELIPTTCKKWMIPHIYYLIQSRELFNEGSL